MQTNSQVSRAHHLRIVINLEPSLPDVSLLPNGVPLSKNLGVHRFLRAFSSHDDLQMWEFLIFIDNVEGLNKHHEVFIGCVGR